MTAEGPHQLRKHSRCQEMHTCRYKAPSQQHFYMEPQGAVVLPDEAGTFTVTSSTQSLDGVQKAVAETLGITLHKVTAVCRRVGGGFGGKAVRPMPVAAACAVAAHKLGKQVRLTYNRNADFRQNGGGLLCLPFPTRMYRVCRCWLVRGDVLHRVGHYPRQLFSSIIHSRLLLASTIIVKLPRSHSDSAC